MAPVRYLSFVGTTMMILLLLVVAQDTTVASRKSVFFFCIHYVGHINPLIAQAIEMHNRGWDVYISSTENRRGHITKLVPPGIKFVSAGDCTNDELRDTFQSAFKNQESFVETDAVFDWIFSLYPCIYPNLLSNVSAISPSLMVVDYVSLQGMDVAKKLNIPFIVNVASLVSMIPTTILEPFYYSPGIMSNLSINAVGNAFFLRLIYPPLIQYARIYWSLTFARRLNSYRSLCNLEPIDSSSMALGSIHFVNMAFGLEYPRPLPPYIHLLGPMIIESENNKTLSESELEWFGKSELPIVYISMGTLASLTKKNKMAIKQAVSTLTDIRVLWKTDDVELLSDLHGDKYLVTQWVTSQYAILRDRRVHLFISHCGLNSINEAIHFGTKLLCIPIFADQQDYAQRIADAGVGLVVFKSYLNENVELLKESIQTLIQDKHNYFKQNVTRLQTLFEFAGGVKRAGDIIEYVAEYRNVNDLLTRDLFVPAYAYYNLDVYAVYMVVLWGVYRLFRLFCCCGRCRRKRKAD